MPDLLASPPRITPQEGSPGSPSYVGYHHVWGVLSETQARHLVAEAGPQRRKRYQARGGFFLCKNTAISPCKTFIVKKKNVHLLPETLLSTQLRPGSRWDECLPSVTTWGNLHLSRALFSTLRRKAVRAGGKLWQEAF